MTMYFAGIMELEPQVVGWVSNVDDMKISIVARREPLTGRWEPLYGIRNEGSARISLPHCYRMTPTAEVCLENHFIAEMEARIELHKPETT